MTKLEEQVLVSQISANKEQSKFTLRDKFATVALHGLLIKDESMNIEEMTEKAYKIADCMLQQKSKF